MNRKRSGTILSEAAVNRRDNRRDNREVPVCLTRTGLVAHDAMVAGALERNQRVLEELGKEKGQYCREMSIVRLIWRPECSMPKKLELA